MTTGITRGGFGRDLHIGEVAEDSFAELIGVSVGRDIEVKSDKWARRSGNLAIEIYQSGAPSFERRPSGISVTLAQWWAHEFHDNCWLLLPTDVMKSVVRRASSEGRRRSIGDFNLYENVLPSWEYFDPRKIREAA